MNSIQQLISSEKDAVNFTVISSKRWSNAQKSTTSVVVTVLYAKSASNNDIATRTCLLRAACGTSFIDTISVVLYIVQELPRMSAGSSISRHFIEKGIEVGRRSQEASMYPYAGKRDCGNTHSVQNEEIG